MKIEVKVRAGAKQDRLTPMETAGSMPLFVVELKASARDGKANAALIKLLSRHFGVPQAAIAIKRGATSRQKIIEVTSLPSTAL